MGAYASYRVSLSRYDLQSQMVDMKKDLPWLRDVNSQSLQSALMHLDAAYLMFFKGVSSFPVFKNKRRSQSFQCPQNVFVEKGEIHLPKFKTGIRIILSRPIDGLIKTVTISKTPTGKFFASILIEDGKELPKAKPITQETSVGLDLGIKTFLVSSDGVEVENPKPLRKAMARLKVLQKRASKKKKGSNNRNKANKRVALLHEKVTNIRKDFLHKTSTAIVKQYDTVVIENLNVAGMVKNHSLAQAISDVSWSEFTRQLDYKALWSGKNIVRIGRFEPSSKLHNECGYLNKELTLKDREWACPKCGKLVDRDLNAAINIKKFGLLKNSGAAGSGEPVELPTLVGTMKQESFR